MRSKITALVAAVAAGGQCGRGRADARSGELEVADTKHESRGSTSPRSPRPSRRRDEDRADDAAPDPTPVATHQPSDSPDDLTAIKGLGKVKAAKLVASGITSYAQIAAWTDDDIAEIGLAVNTSPGQIKREDWVGQATVLAEG